MAPGLGSETGLRLVVGELEVGAEACGQSQG